MSRCLSCSTFAQWQQWFYEVSEQSGLFEFRDATYLAVENMRTVGLEFTGFPAGYDVYVEAALDSYYLFEPNGSFFASDNFIQPNPNTYVFNADSSIEFQGLNFQHGFSDDSEVVMLNGPIDFNLVRTINLGESLDPEVQDWDAINFSELDSEVNINLADLNLIFSM